MVLNNYIITYLVCSFLSLFIGTAAALTGLKAYKKWDITSDLEEQYCLEKKVYLIITLLSLGFILRLLMVPLWFRTLQSMIISISGAMCLVGVHNINAPLSCIASILKIILPALYGYWLVLHLLDRQVVTQPFMKQKLMFLAPLGILILLETIMDVSFLLSVPPRQVSCCSSLFDAPRENIPQIVMGSTWLWILIFYFLAVLIIGEIVYLLIAQKKSALPGKGGWFGKKSIMFSETLIIVFSFVVFVLGLHTKIAPLFLKLPSHHCIFCLGQKVWDALLSFCMVFSGLTLLLIYFWVVSSPNYKDVNEALSERMLTLLKCSGGLFLGGVTILLIHLYLVIPGYPIP